MRPLRRHGGLLVLRAAGAMSLVIAAVLTSTPARASDASALQRTGDVITFGVQPATAVAPDRRATFDYLVSPGSRVVDHVAVVNYSTRALTVHLYAADAVRTSSGGVGAGGRG